jgi:sugar lactone lactonase YvrE
MQGQIAAVTHVNELVTRPESTAIALDRRGNVYLLDPPASAILKYSKTHDGGLALTSRIDIRDVKYPWGLAVDQNERIFILDNNRIDMIDQRNVRGGSPDRAYNIPQADATASRMYYTGPAADSSGNLFVAASELHVGGGMSTTVYVLLSTATDPARWARSIGGFLTGLGGPGDFVDGLALDRQGNLYILATSPLRILEFARGAQGNVSPVTIYSISGGSELSACCLGVGPDGMLYLGTRAGNSIMTYDTGR